MKKKSINKQDKIAKKEESVLITKESVSAVCILFSLLILLILFTDSLIFGEIGRLTQDFFLGVFGYFAYPVFIGAICFSFSVFLDKRLVKNRLGFFTLNLAVISFALVLQIVFTYSWKMENYATACFVAGETLASSTILGWLGGVIISSVISTLGKIGALIVFSLLCLISVYVTALAWGKKSFTIRKNPKKANSKELTKTENDSVPENTGTVDFVSEQPEQSVYPPMQRESFSGSAYSYAPKPSVIINENDYYAEKPVGNGFSPFNSYQQPRQAQTVTNATTEIPTDEEGRRNFLLNNSPAEIYQKNLIFDRNSSVNKRAPADPNQQSYKVAPTQNTDIQNGFSSYTSSYEDSLNEQTPPQKIYQSETRGVESVPTYNNRSEERESYLNVEREIPAPRFTENYPQNDRASGFGLNLSNDRDRVDVTDRTDRFTRESENRLETPSINPNEESNSTDNGYRRHEYMDYFSLSNPSIFGDERLDDHRGASLDTSRTSRDFSENISRDESIASERFTTSEVSSFGGNRGFESDRTARFEEERTDALNIFDEEESAEPTIQEPIQPERKIGFNDRATTRNLESISFQREKVEPPKQTVEPASVEKVEPVKKPRIYRPYVPAPLHYFDCTDIIPDADPTEVEETKIAILKVYERVGFTDISISSVSFGPSLTRYNLVASPHIIPTRLATKDIESAMAMALRDKKVNVYLNYEEGVVSVEVPNKQRQTVQLGCMLSGSEYTDAKPTSLVFSIGKDVVNKKMYGDICKMVHLLVAGSTGSGKSVFLNTLIVSLINRYSPEQLRLILIDPKKTEFVIYNNLPHLMIDEIITDPRKAIQSLNWAVGEMNRRYELFAKMSKEGKHVVNLDEYNAAVSSQEEKLPKIVIVVDELADLMLASKKEVEERIQNITQKSRAAGIHMIIATQRPSTDVITGVIKANLATRIAFMVASDVDSRVILDASGAQKLLGYGDMLYGTVGREPTRAQCAFISSGDCQKIVNFIKENNEAYFDDEATTFINNSGHAPVGDEETGEAIVEEVYIEALKFVILSNSASISMIQRKCSVGYNKAGKIVEWMEDMGYISPYDGAKARKVLISKEEFEGLYGEI